MAFCAGFSVLWGGSVIPMLMEGDHGILAVLLRGKDPGGRAATDTWAEVRLRPRGRGRQAGRHHKAHEQTDDAFFHASFLASINAVFSTLRYPLYFSRVSNICKSVTSMNPGSYLPFPGTKKDRACGLSLFTFPYCGWQCGTPWTPAVCPPPATRRCRWSPAPCPRRPSCRPPAPGSWCSTRPRPAAAAVWR